MTTGGLGAAIALRREPVLRSRAAKGDARAFAVLYERHHQALYRYCRSILQHDEDARDAVQSAMMRAFAALRDEQRDFELRPWLFRIAHNEAISALRRRRPTEELDRAAGLCGDDLAQHVLHRERLAQLRVDLGDLPERQRAALVLRELSGLSHGEIAVVLDCSPRSVKQTIFEARAALGECAEGRAMSCDEVQRRLSDADRRVLRGRRVRSHLRSCRSCTAFQAALGQRPAELAALAPPLPVAAGGALLAQLLAGTPAGAGAAAITGTKTVAVIAVSAAMAGGAGTAATQVLRDDGATAARAPASERPGAAAPAARRAAGTPSWSPPARAALGASSRALDQAQGGTGRSQAGRRARAGASVAEDGRAIPGPGAAAGHQPGGGAGTASGNGKHARTLAAARSQRGRRPARTPASSTSRGSGKPATSTTSARRRPAGTPTGPAAAAKRERPARGGGAAATGSPGTAQRSAARGGERAAQPQAPQARGAGPAVPASAGRTGDPATVRAASGVPSGPPAAGGRPK